MSRSVPEKWLPYKAYGDVIKGTKIVAFKVPLKETFRLEEEAQLQQRREHRHHHHHRRSLERQQRNGE